MKVKVQGCSSAFSLVELLTALAVFSIILITMIAILDSTLNISFNSDNKRTSDYQAAAALDRMAIDLGQLVKRTDVDVLCFKATGNDSIYFYSQTSSYFDGTTFTTSQQDSVALVGYRINANTYQLERLGKSLAWTGDSGNPPYPSLLSLTYSSPGAQLTSGTSILTSFPTTLGSSPYNSGTDTDFHVLSPNVFRMEITFILKDGTQSGITVMSPSTTNLIPSGNLAATVAPSKSNDSSAIAPLTSLSSNYAPNSRWYNTLSQIGYYCTDSSQGNAVWRPLGMRDVAAIVVTLATVDNQGISLSQANAFSLTTLSAKFTDGLDSSIEDTWIQAITNGFSSSTIPKSVASHLGVYQRCIYISGN